MNVHWIAAASAIAAVFGGASGASAQPYDYRPLPPAPYYSYGYAGSQGGGEDRFTLLGAHAGVTVLGLDLSGGVRLSVPTGEGYGGGESEGYAPRAYAPPPPPEPYGYQGGYEEQAPPQMYAPPPSYGYMDPCACMPRW